MVEIECLNCKKSFTKNYNTEYSGSETCPYCHENMIITIIDNKLVSTFPSQT